jgi:hypothetical protein
VRKKKRKFLNRRRRENKFFLEGMVLDRFSDQFLFLTKPFFSCDGVPDGACGSSAGTLATASLPQ